MAEDEARGRESEADRKLRDLYALLTRTAASAGDHLDEQTWERLACGELEPSARDAALEHVTGCAECAAIHRGLAMLQAEAPAFDPDVPSALGASAAPARVSIPRWGYAAGAVAAGLALVFLLRAPERGPADTDESRLRTPSAPSALVTVEPAGVVRGTPRIFRWQAITGAESYRVRVWSEEGVPVWTSADAPGTAVDMPASVTLAAGKYFWQVTATASGQAIAESQLVALTIVD